MYWEALILTDNLGLCEAPIGRGNRDFVRQSLAKRALEITEKVMRRVGERVTR